MYEMDALVGAYICIHDIHAQVMGCMHTWSLVTTILQCVTDSSYLLKALI
jgi:hypothetical protein